MRALLSIVGPDQVEAAADQLAQARAVGVRTLLVGLDGAELALKGQADHVAAAAALWPEPAFRFGWSRSQALAALRPWALRWALQKAPTGVLYQGPAFWGGLQASIDPGGALLSVLALSLNGDEEARLPALWEHAGGLHPAWVRADPGSEALLDAWALRVKEQWGASVDPGPWPGQAALIAWADSHPAVHVLRDPAWGAAWHHRRTRGLQWRDGRLYGRQGPVQLLDLAALAPQTTDAQGRAWAGSAARRASRFVPEPGFSDATAVTDADRRNFRLNPFLRSACQGDPWSRPEAFFSVQARPQDEAQGLPLLSPVMEAIWLRRPDLQLHFPRPFGEDRSAFLAWFVQYAGAEYGLSEAALAPALASWQASQDAARPALRPQGARRGRLRRLFAAVRSSGAPVRAWRFKPSRAPRARREGVDLVGYARAELGLGEGLRLIASCLEAAEVPFSIIDLPLSSFSRHQDLRWAHREALRPSRRVALLCTTPDSIGGHGRVGDLEALGDAFRIGYWHWELPQVPPRCYDAFGLVDELWAPSQFVKDALAPHARQPLHCLPYGVAAPWTKGWTRRDLGLPEQGFLFLAMYDAQSYAERKNPFGALQAFQRAFEPGQAGVGLVLKVNAAAADAPALLALRQRSEGWPNILLLTEVLDRGQVHALSGLCDATVSLHRSEGFGLPMAEAMAQGRPVLATAWSANLDFMDADSACLVPYRLLTLEKDVGAYPAGSTWADPDLDAAAEAMRRLVADPAAAAALGRAGQARLAATHDPLIAGLRMRERLRQLGALD